MLSTLPRLSGSSARSSRSLAIAADGGSSCGSTSRSDAGKRSCATKWRSSVLLPAPFGPAIKMRSSRYKVSAGSSMIARSPAYSLCASMNPMCALGAGTNSANTRLPSSLCTRIPES